MVAEVARLRRQRYTGQQIVARAAHLASDRQPAFLPALGSIGWQALEPAELVRRYEREHPANGSYIHINW